MSISGLGHVTVSGTMCVADPHPSMCGSGRLHRLAHLTRAACAAPEAPHLLGALSSAPYGTPIRGSPPREPPAARGVGTRYPRPSPRREGRAGRAPALRGQVQRA